MTETTLAVTTEYAAFSEFWETLLTGTGPVGAFGVSLGDADRSALKEAMLDRLGSPAGSFELSAVARAVRGTVPAPTS